MIKKIYFNLFYLLFQDCFAALPLLLPGFLYPFFCLVLLFVPLTFAIIIRPLILFFVKAYSA